MIAWIANLSAVDWTFLTCAVLGSMLFVARLVLMFVGVGGGEADAADAGPVDVPHDVPAGDAGHAGGADAGHHAGSADSYVGFKLMSFQGVTAFLMMFGLVGLATSKGSGFGPYVSLGAAILGGLVCVLVIGQLFRMFGKLQSSGTLDYRNAVGKIGTVYMTIPKGAERGKVNIEVQGRLMTLEASSEDGSKLSTDTRVVVTRVVSGNVLVVKPEVSDRIEPRPGTGTGDPGKVTK